MNFLIQIEQLDPVSTNDPRPLSVMMVDPSNFSLSYDHCLCDALTEQGCEITLYRSENIHASSELPASFISCNHFYKRTHALARDCSRGKLWRVAKAGEHVFGMNRLLREAAKLKPDVIHFQWLALPSLDRFFLPRLRRIAPLVLTLHNTTVFHGTASAKFLGAGLVSSFANFDAVIVHAEYSMRRAIDQGWIAQDKIHRIPHGALTHYRTFRTPATPDPDKQVVLFFGNIKEYKGVDVLLRAFAGLPRELMNGTELRIMGKPSMDVGPLRNLAASLGITAHIRWDLRFVEEHEVPAAFEQAAVVVLPYREIDQSGVLLTAIAFDKAIVASNIGGMSETIRDGVHGHLVPPGEVEPLTEALLDVLRNRLRRHEMQKEVARLRSDLSWNNIASSTLQLYRTISKRCSTLPTPYPS